MKLAAHLVQDALRILACNVILYSIYDTAFLAIFFLFAVFLVSLVCFGLFRLLIIKPLSNNFFPLYVYFSYGILTMEPIIYNIYERVETTLF